MSDLRDPLAVAAAAGRSPVVRAFHRIDGPGSSLDLREFQQALWRLPSRESVGLAGDGVDSFQDVTTAASVPNLRGAGLADPAMPWSAGLARTTAMTIDTGTRIIAEPFDEGAIAVRSVEYDVEVTGRPGRIPATSANWLLKIVESFGISGVRFVLRNLVDGTHSSGLGGSATAATGTAVLANALAGGPLDATQLAGMASRMEQECGISLTGTQEQSNVVYGGVVDYLWCPWGIPGEVASGYGSSIRTTLLDEEQYGELEARMMIVHTGLQRASSDTNAAWIEALSDPDGLEVIDRKLAAAYAYREAIRELDWPAVTGAIRSFRAARTELCPDYMTGAHELHDWVEDGGGAVFPLGAGGGGGLLVWHDRPDGLSALRGRIGDAYREIPFRLRATGHELENLPLG
jgi:D-glycero-alpha-D-manno-heptose-7-phosphate kinase